MRAGGWLTFGLINVGSTAGLCLDVALGEPAALFAVPLSVAGAVICGRQAWSAFRAQVEDGAS